MTATAIDVHCDDVVAAMARIASAVVAMAGERPVGINVLRNDALAALGIAAASGARVSAVPRPTWLRMATGLSW